MDATLKLKAEQLASRPLVVPPILPTKAHSVAAVDYDQVDKTCWHVVATALLKPAAPKAVEIAQMSEKQYCRMREGSESAGESR